MEMGSDSACENMKQIIESSKARSLRILDFGGGGGSHGFAFLGQVRWAVVETSARVEASTAVLSSDGLSFHSKIEKALEYLGRVDVLHVSSALQYTPSPKTFLLELLRLSPEVLVFESLVTTDRSRPYRFMQYSFLKDNYGLRNDKRISKWKSIRYPLTAMSRADVMTVILKNYEIDRVWEYPTQSHFPSGRGLAQWGFIASKRR